MMRLQHWLVAAAVLLAPEAAAQDTSGRGELHRRIEERFAARVREELALTDQQAQQLRATLSAYAGRRRALEVRERDLRAALAGQLRPGIAADRDSVTRLTDELVGLKRRHADTYAEEMREVAGFLDPVQRAQLFIMRERLVERARSIRERHRRGH